MLHFFFHIYSRQPGEHLEINTFWETEKIRNAGAERHIVRGELRSRGDDFDIMNIISELENLKIYQLQTFNKSKLSASKLR